MPQHAPRILLIDDNKHGLVARRSVLEEQGYEVDTARSAREGLAKFDDQAFDVVVTDYRMPKVNGLEVLSKIRQSNKRVPVVILSGYAKKLGLTKRSTGADAVLMKGPSEGGDLVRTIGALVKKKPGSQRAQGASAPGRQSRIC